MDVVSPRRRTTGSSRHRVVDWCCEAWCIDRGVNASDLRQQLVDCAESEDVAIAQLVVVDQTGCGHIPQCGLDDPAILVGMLVRVGWVRDDPAILVGMLVRVGWVRDDPDILVGIPTRNVYESGLRLNV